MHAGARKTAALARSDRRAAAAAAALAEELAEVIGDGVLLHPPFHSTAPRHHMTTARPWLQAPCSIFNLLGLPATQIPLGLDRQGLPLGVQAVAARDRDHATIAVAVELERSLGGWVPPS